MEPEQRKQLIVIVAGLMAARREEVFEKIRPGDQVFHALKAQYFVPAQSFVDHAIEFFKYEPE